MIYYLNIHQYDYCNNWEAQVLHTHNKKQLEDLAIRLRKRYKDPCWHFDVCELVVAKDSCTNDQIKEVLRFEGCEL